jgi:hypothetical protein
MRNLILFSGFFFGTFATFAYADTSEADKTPKESIVSIDNFLCLWYGDADDRAHFYELRLADEYRRKRSDLVEVGAVTAVGLRLQEIVRPEKEGHETLHIGAIAQSGSLRGAGASRDELAAIAAGDAFLRWIDETYTQAHIVCPAAAPAKYRPVTEQLPELDAKPTGKSVLTLLREEWNSPASMIPILEDPENWKALETDGKLGEAIQILVDRSIDIQVARMMALKKVGKSSPKVYQESLDLLVEVSELAEKAGSTYRMDQVGEVISVLQDKLNPMEVPCIVEPGASR